MLPLKIGSLVAKTVTKPIAKQFASYAQTSPYFKSICQNVGQFHHRMFTSVNVRLLGHHVKRIKPVDPQKALKDGASFLSEMLILSVSSALLIGEYTRSEYMKSRKSAAQKERHRAEMQEVNNRLASLEESLEALRRDGFETRHVVARSLTSISEDIEELKGSHSISGHRAPVSTPTPRRTEVTFSSPPPEHINPFKDFHHDSSKERI